MNMPVLKIEAEAAELPDQAGAAAIAASDSRANVIAMTPRRPPWTARVLPALKNIAVNVVPPVIVIALFLLLWEWVCRRTGATLPQGYAVLAWGSSLNSDAPLGAPQPPVTR